MNSDPVQAARGLMQHGRMAEAAALLRPFVAMPDGPVEALHLFGVTEHRQGRPGEAVAFYRACLDRAPDHLKCRNNLAAALLETGRAAEAVPVMAQACALAPNEAGPLYTLGCLHLSLGAFEPAEACFRAVLGLAPGHDGAMTNLAVTLKDRGHLDEAEALYRGLIAGRPDDAGLLASLADVVYLAGRYDESLAISNRALGLDSGHPGALINRGNIHIHRQDFIEAEADLRHALKRAPDDWLSHFNLAIILLRSGRLAEGWDEYEWRLRNPARRACPLDLPQWQGEALPGRLLVWAEEGIGDEILHAGAIPDLVARGRVARGVDCVLECAPRLVPLFSRSFPEIEVVARGDVRPDSTLKAQIALPSLGRLLRRSFDDFPARASYLKADEALSARLRQRYAPHGEKLVGVSWISRNDRLGGAKSSALLEWAPVLTQPGTRFVSLQYGDQAADLAAVRAHLGIDILRDDDIDPLADLDGFAAQVAAMDEIVSISNTTVHVAGALGVKCTTLLPFGRGQLWYWFDQRDDSPFYRSLRLLRQEKPGDWSGPLARVTV